MTVLMVLSWLWNISVTTATVRIYSGEVLAVEIVILVTGFSDEE